MKQTVSIVWFKRDLRIQDHAPLLAATQTGNAVLPLYVVEPELWQQPDASRRHWHFIHDCLTQLNIDLNSLGQPLCIQTGDMCETLTKLNKQYTIKDIFAHEETGNLWSFTRDLSVHEFCRQKRILFHEFPANGVVRRLSSRDDWAKIRNSRMAEPIKPKPTILKPLNPQPFSDLPPKSSTPFGTSFTGSVQVGGRSAGVDELRSYLVDRSSAYLYHISAPGLSEYHCSRLSAHIAWGTLSIREIVQSIAKRRAQLTPEEKRRFGRNLNAFETRLAWRCHFVQKLEDQPQIETHCMHPAFERLRVYEHNEQRFQAWCTGQTGYPFIDACMRNLIATGWITFRMRAMLVSFASYQLWLDWRLTALHLARLFTDYEPGIHYSQLQMQSGVTGINAMRVYNPIKQSTEHDPEGLYIKKWVPELNNVPAEYIHEPWKLESSLLDTGNFVLGTDYPQPIVDHTITARHAKEKITEVRKTLAFRSTAKAVHKKLGSRKKQSQRTSSPKAKTDQLSLI